MIRKHLASSTKAFLFSFVISYMAMADAWMRRILWWSVCVCISIYLYVFVAVQIEYVKTNLWMVVRYIHISKTLWPFHVIFHVCFFQLSVFKMPSIHGLPSWGKSFWFCPSTRLEKSFNIQSTLLFFLVAVLWLGFQVRWSNFAHKIAREILLRFVSAQGCLCE